MLNSAPHTGTRMPPGSSWSRRSCWANGTSQPSRHSLPLLFYLTLPQQDIFFFLPCMPERAERAASAFCSFSSSSLSQCEPGENITASHWIKNWWDRPQNAAYSGAGTKPAVHRVKSQEPPTAWLSLTSAHLTTAPKPKCHPAPKP